MEVLSFIWFGIKALISSIAAVLFLAVLVGVGVGILLWFCVWVAGMFEKPDKKDSVAGDAADTIGDILSDL
jgi:hypothetical protein